MNSDVLVIADAEEDLYEIYNYIAANDSINKAEYILTKLEDACNSLSTFPNRGHLPPELERIGIYEYQEIHFKPYRIIYQITESTVYIHCVLDGRRDMQQLLQRRLLR